MPGGLTNRLLVDERSLGRGGDSEGSVQGPGTSLEYGACGFTCIDKAVISVSQAGSSRAEAIAASNASLSPFRWTCCDYNFVYTLFPAPILHNMDIIIGLVLCTPQSRFATLR